MASTPISKHIPMVYNPAEVMAIVFAPTLTLSGSSCKLSIVSDEPTKNNSKNTVALISNPNIERPVFLGLIIN